MKKLETIEENKELLKDLISAFLKNTEENDYFSDELFQYEYLLDNLNKDVDMPNCYVLVEETTNKKELLDILFLEELYGFTIVDPLFIFDTKNLLLFLREKHPNWIISTEYVDLSMFKYVPISLKSRVNPNYELELINHRTIWKYNISTDIVSDFEKRLIPQDDLTKLNFEWISYNDFKKYSIYDECLFLKTWNKNGFSTFYGFHYFKPESTYLNCYYLIAKDSEGKWVGVIKTYDTDNHYTIGYIDVFYTARNKGVATKMIAELKTYLTKKQPIYLTPLSDCGKKYKIDETFKRVLSDYEIFVL